MASTFTTNKHIEKPASGDYNNAWAAPVNADWDDIDNALGGSSSISVTGVGAGTYALTLPQYQPPNIKFTGTLTANLNYQLPAGVGGIWTISNGTTGAFTLTFSVNGGGSFVLPQGQRSQVVCDAATIALTQAPPAATPATSLVYYGVDTGIANAYACTISNLAAYADGIEVHFAPTHANTAASTLNINALGAIPILDVFGQPVTSGALTVGVAISVLYKGGSFFLPFSQTVNISGSFTATLVGCTTSPTLTMQYRKQGNFVMLFVLTGITGISNSTSFSFTGLPTAIRPPSFSTISGFWGATNNGVSGQFAGAQFQNSTGVSLYWNGNVIGWTASGNKGIDSGATIIYPYA